MNRKRRPSGRLFHFLYLLELLLTCSTQGASPIVGEILKSSSCLNTILRVTNRGVINPSTGVAYVLIHNLNVFVCL